MASISVTAGGGGGGGGTSSAEESSSSSEDVVVLELVSIGGWAGLGLVGWVEAMGTKETGAGASSAGAQLPRKAGLASLDWSAPLVDDSAAVDWLLVVAWLSVPALRLLLASSSFPLRLPLLSRGEEGLLVRLSA